MPSVYLEDDEVVDLIIERPHLIQKAMEKIQAESDKNAELFSTCLRSNRKLRDRLKELEDKP